MDRTQLLARRADLHAQATTIAEGMADLAGDPLDAAQAEFDGAMAEIESVDAKLANLDRLATIGASLDKPNPRKTQPGADAPAARTEIGKVRERVQDDPKLGWNNMADFALGVFEGSRPGGNVDERLKIGAATGMSQGTGSDGGFLVPPEFSTTIYDGVMGASESLIGMTDNYTVTGESLTFPANAETDRATGSRWGGVRGYWISEAAQITSSKPKLRQVKIEPQQLAVLVYATDKLLRNGPAAAQYLTRAARDEINFLLGDSIINGDGAGKPVGIVGHASVVSVAKEAGQAATTLVKANIDKMWSRCLAKARARAVWIINQDVEPQLEALSADVGTGGVPVYLPAGGITETPNARLKGRPVIVSEYAATLGTVGDIILADMSSYLTGTRGGVQEAMSMHLRFDYAETAFRFMFEADGQPWLASAITPFKGTANTLSPLVTLATRA